MKLYAEIPGLRTRQVATDLLLAVWILLWVRIGQGVHGLVGRLAGPGEAVEEAGTRIAGALTAGGTRIDDLPAIGGALRRPFDAIASGGSSLARAGVLQQDAVATLALALGVAVAVVPIVWFAARYLPWRIRFVREATAAAHLRRGGAGPEMFAFRALANRSLRELAAISDDPWADFEAGRRTALAQLELRALGLRPDAE